MLQDNHSINAAGHFCVAGFDAVLLAEEYGTPAYIMDEERLRSNMRRYSGAMARYFPAGSMPLMASKALSFREIYRIARDEGIGTDIVSGGELYTALSAGLPPERMCFHGSAKTLDEIRFAIESGVGLIAVDNAVELSRVGRCAAERGGTQRVLLRLTPGIDPHTFAAVNTGRVDSKFGAAIGTGQAMALTRAALRTPGVELMGFHCHIGSQIAEAEPFLDAVDIMTRFMAEARDTLGFTASVLNLGGGFAVPYVEGDPAPDVEELIRRAASRLRSDCAALSLPVPVVFMEPGRGISASAGVTLYTVQDVKTIPGLKSYVAVDGGMTDDPRFALYGAKYTVVNASRAAGKADFTADIAGRCCESGDLIGTGVSLRRPEPGDILAVLVTGAYNYSMASNYNRVPRPPVVMLRDGASRVVVRRETYEDLVACDL